MIESRWTRTVLLTLVAGVAFVVLLVLVAAGWGPLVAADRAVVVAADAALGADPPLTTFVRTVTGLGGSVAVDVLTGSTAVGLLIGRRVRAAVFVLVVRALELATETVTKSAVGRPRPVVAVALDVAGGASFPSGHTAGTAAFWTSVLVLLLPVLGRRRRIAASLLVASIVVAIAASRVLLAVHYPSDVVGGALLGVMCALAAHITLIRPGRDRPPRS